MALTRLTKDMDIIQKLGDEPNDVDGLSSAELKAKFDEGNNAMKQWVNDTFIPEVENEIKASRLENLPEHAHTHAKDGRDPITPADIGFDHSAQEIDDAVTKVEGGPSALGAAPAGYGYGEELETVSALSTSESIEVFGAKLDAIINKMTDRCAKQVAVSPPWAYWHGYYFSTIYKWTSDYVVVIASSLPFCGVNIGQGWKFARQDGVWKPVEWVNPPMQLGVEYRTTERYLGKPVYSVLVDVGAMPNTGSKYFFVPPDIVPPYVDKVIYACGIKQTGVGGTIPWNYDDDYIEHAVYQNGGQLVVALRTNYDVSTVTAYYHVKYTKTTD